ncbi:hypothetical protein SEUCBS139899_009196 [Sporothrix eucalyptigena]|uniref:Uncharacterized protein n=1 Tax=Sporothrix eucalyptigena TaxID=1812306 RepID=A0ABP0C026_9PEZI
MQNHPSLHVQPDYQMVPMAPLEEQVSHDAASDNKTDFEIYTSTVGSTKGVKTDPSSATASLLSPTPAPPFSAQSTFSPEGGGRYAGTRPEPKRLGPEWGRRIFSLIAEVCIATLSLLFAVYGILIYKHDGRSVDSNAETGRKLYSISQYAPTVFPMLFAAVVGSCLKGIVTYSLQTGQGATIGMLEQLLGSQSIYRAIATQIRMHAFNPLGILLVLLWSLSPLGGQASLRVISIGPYYPQNITSVFAINTFQKILYGNGNNANMALTTVATPAMGAMMGASLLGDRNQDLWGNVRLPAIETVEAAALAAGNTSVDGWYAITETTNLTYASLVGTPVAQLPANGNTSFTLSGAYMSFSCPILERMSGTAFTNYTNAGNNTAPDPGNGYDCTWAVASESEQYQVAFSLPCNQSVNYVIDESTPRPARKLIWESMNQDQVYSHAECDVTETHVDANITCTGSNSGFSKDSTCTATHVRRSLDPSTPNGNFTVFDMGFIGDPASVVKLLTSMFPYGGLEGYSEPVIAYMANPYDCVGVENDSDDDIPTYQVSQSVFEVRLAQLLNSILYLGLEEPGQMTGGFNISDTIATAVSSGVNTTTNILTANAINIIEEQVVICSKPWLGVLIFSSLILFLMALVGAVLRLLTIVPDVLESVTLAFLHHQTDGVVGASVWTASEWARRNRLTRLFFGDVQPTGEVGRLALSTVGNPRPVGPIQVGRIYM